MSDQRDYKWTGKLPLLIAALISLLLALPLMQRRLVGLGLLFLLLAAFLFWQAETIQGWCAPTNAHYGQMVWGEHKFHELTFWDCVRMMQ
jgi:hypothetical protein